MVKFVLKCGEIQVEYEGTEEFLKQEIPELVEGIAAKLRSVDIKPKATPQDASADTRVDGQSVSTVAQKLSVKKGTELVLAAALTLQKTGAGTFTKKQLRDRAREATTFWKASYGNNFDNYVSRLVKGGRLNHTGGENYALPDERRKELLKQIAA